MASIERNSIGGAKGRLLRFRRSAWGRAAAFQVEIMAQQETEQLTRILNGAARSRAVSTIAELGVADLVKTGQPQPVEYLAKASKTHEPSLYRILRFLASHGLFRETENRHFDHTPLSAALRTDAPGSYRAGAQMFHHLFPGWRVCITRLRPASPVSTKSSARPSSTRA